MQVPETFAATQFTFTHHELHADQGQSPRPELTHHTARMQFCRKVGAITNADFLYF